LVRATKELYFLTRRRKTLLILPRVWWRTESPSIFLTAAG